MRLHHICLQTNKPEDSLLFYTSLLGFTLEEKHEGFHGRDQLIWLERDGFRLELQTPKADQGLLEAPYHAYPIPHFAFEVEALEDYLQKAKELKVCTIKKKHDREIYEVMGGRLMKLISPEGILIELREKEK